MDSEKIRALKFPTFWFEPTPQGKFMLNIAFGQSKYFVDNLSENTKRGLRQKLRRGELPGYAPLGYLNDLRMHAIVKDFERLRLVKKIFELYATGNYSLKDLQKLITSAGLLSRNNKVLSVSVIQHTLSNPFYYGIFKYNEEMYQGKHEPMISKKLFDKCKKVLADRSRPKKPSQKEYPFRNLLKCGECGCAITSETQKGHDYYRCTKKKISCSQKYVREENLAKQISKILQKVSLPRAWMGKMIAELDKEKAEAVQAGAVFAQNLKEQIKECEEKLDTLLDTHLEGTISKEEYVQKKQKILNQKVETSEKLKDFERNGNHWLEPAKRFISDANQTQIVAEKGNPKEKAEFLKKVGSNLILVNQNIKYFPRGAWKIFVNLGNFDAEPRSGEAEINANFSKLPTMLRG